MIKIALNFDRELGQAEVIALEELILENNN